MVAATALVADYGVLGTRAFRTALRGLVPSPPDSPRPEDRGPDPYDGGSFRYRRLEIAGHAHREGVEAETFRIEVVEDLAKQAEGGALGLEVRRGAGDSHEAAQPQPGQLAG